MITIPGRIPIRIFPIFWLLITVIGWINSDGNVLATTIWAIVIFLSVLIHEYGHALTALAFGQEAHINLVGLGGVTQRSGKKLRLWQDFIIIFNGPLAGVLFLLAAELCLMIFSFPEVSLIRFALTITVQANIFWTILNLLPVHPLDGGRLLSIVMEALLGVRGIKISLFVSCLCSIVISILFFLSSLFIAGILFLMLTFESYRAWRESLAVTEKDQDDGMQALLKQAEEELQKGKTQVAKEKLERIREEVSKGVIYVKSTEYLALLLSKEGKFQEAYAILTPLKNKISPEALRLLHQIAYQNNAWQDAIEIGNQAYQTYPTYDIALTNALCHSLLCEARPAVGWLQRALSDGMPNLKTVLSKHEFDGIRNSAVFQEFTNKTLY